MQNLEAGRELDALIAERVMGWDLDPGRDWGLPPKGSPHAGLDGGDDCLGFLVPHYSTDIAAAWEVLEHVANGRRDRYPTVWQDKGTDAWVCEFGQSIQSQWCDTVALAICSAGLKAVGYV